MPPLIPEIKDDEEEHGAFDDYCEELLDRMRGAEKPSRDEMDRFLIRSSMHSNRQRVRMDRRIVALEFHVRMVYFLIVGVAAGSGAVWWVQKETNVRPSSVAPASRP